MTGTNLRTFTSVFMTVFSDASVLFALPQKMYSMKDLTCFMLANEICSLTGRPHVHIIAKFSVPKSGTAIWEALGLNCDLRPIRHWGKSINYLKKEDPHPISYQMEDPALLRPKFARSMKPVARLPKGLEKYFKREKK